MRKNMKNIILASISVVIAVFIVTLLLSLIDSIGRDYSSIIISFVVSGIASVVAAIVTLIWAIPMHFILAKYHRIHLGWYLLLAVVPSFVFVYGFKPFGNDSAATLVMQTVVCSLVGSIGALVFWYVVVYKQRITKSSSKDAASGAA